MNFSRLILLAAWFGAALFFGAVVAPAAFGVLRSFGLPNTNEIAGAIGVSRSSVTRDWQMARAWLFRRLTIGTVDR